MRLPVLILLVCGPLLLGACAGTRPAAHHGPSGLPGPNRFDRRGRAQGRWRTYYDDPAQAQPFTTGRYRHGRPVRTFRYFAPTGALDHSEKYRRQGFCEVTYWYPGGQVARRGPAQWVTGSGQTPRFYWFGQWTGYAPDGQVTGVQQYVDGTLTRAETYQDGKITRAETYKGPKLLTVEIYESGKLVNVETYENNVKISESRSM